MWGGGTYPGIVCFELGGGGAHFPRKSPWVEDFQDGGENLLAKHPYRRGRFSGGGGGGNFLLHRNCYLLLKKVIKVGTVVLWTM